MARLPARLRALVRAGQEADGNEPAAAHVPEPGRRRARSAVWLVPAVCLAGAVAVAILLTVVDADLRPIGGGLLFPGPPAGARSFLSAIVQAAVVV